MKSFLIALALATLSACTPASQDLVDPMTGDMEFPIGINQAPKGLAVGETLYVVSDRLRVRSTPSTQDGNIIDVLAQGDRVIVRKLLDPSSEFVGVTVPSIDNLEIVYVGRAYLTRKKLNSNLFIIQNIATERSRVYRNCGGKFCQHELLLETENVVGDNTRERRTLLGSFKITKWFKFYEDGQNRYPAWYDTRYPFPPLPTDPMSAWFDRAFMPQGRGEIRGGFGWYAAYIGPDASAQWLHGTYGWGANKKDFIQKTRSHGCTRFDNESVAYLRHLISIGTPIARVYAREGLKTMQPVKEKAEWKYILTKDEAQSEFHYESDRQEVLRLGIGKSRWLEEGTYLVNANAKAVAIRAVTPDAGSTIHDNGNTYEIPEASIRGTLWVDQGRIEDYQHPRELEVGGYKDHLIPHSMIWNKE